MTVYGTASRFHCNERRLHAAEESSVKKDTCSFSSNKYGFQLNVHAVILPPKKRHHERSEVLLNSPGSKCRWRCEQAGKIRSASLHFVEPNQYLQGFDSFRFTFRFVLFSTPLLLAMHASLGPVSL